MSDYKFINIPGGKRWIISAPKRASRPRLKRKGCVFCPENLLDETDPIVCSIPEEGKWRVTVKKNKYPFTPYHEVVILTPQHVKSLADVTIEQVRLGIEMYIERYNALKKRGTVVIFGNSGNSAGESIGHPHAQIAVVPENVSVDVPSLEKNIAYYGEHFKVGDFQVICPPYSQWPDEVFIVPLERGRTFGQATYKEIESLSYIWQRLLTIFNIRHGGKFPHNFYIYPYKDWYVRIIPRDKILGGFEMATEIYVNTGDPAETMEFIKENFAETEEKAIRKHKAKYRKGV